MRRKIGGLMLGMWITGIVLAPAAGANQTCNGQYINIPCPWGSPWGGGACVSHDGADVDYDNCIRPN